jgi:hypothetical protein
MKKRIIICVTCIAVAGLYADAQDNSTSLAVQSGNKERLIAPPPPPVPPLPPAAPLPPSMDEIGKPLPPAPPVPPVPPSEEISNSYSDNSGTVIINNNGYEISVVTINERSIVIVKKDGKTQKIKLSAWNADRKYYEKKYGQLPPPPPPPPAPPMD